MSKGNPIVKLRLNPETIRRIEEAIENRENIKRMDTNTLSEWIRGAIDERLAKLDRGRARKASRNTRQPPEDDWLPAIVPDPQPPQERIESNE